MRAARLATVAVLEAVACSAPNSPPPPGPRAVYVTNWASDTISSLATEGDGSLRGPATTLSVGNGATHPQASVRSPDGRWLYVGNWGTRDVTPLRIEADGTLTPFPSAPGPAPQPVTPSGIAPNPAGNALYTANFGNGGAGTVSQYTISPDGRPHGVRTVSAHGRATTGLAVAPDGHTLVTANSGSGDASSFRIAGDGSLTWVSTVHTGAGAFFAAITPDSGRVLVTNSKADTLSVLRLSADSHLAPVATVANPAAEPRGIVLDRTGDRAYVANFAGGTGPGHITVFAIEGTTVRPLGPAIPTGSNGAEGITLSGDGKTLYNANFNANGAGSVTSYPVAADGSLGPPRPPVLTGGRQPDLTSVTAP